MGNGIRYHFTPEKGWMNDPNGTIYIDGVYHLFYQYYPDDIVWGPMHWGHATSVDLINWKHEEIALYPDEDGYIFSGSCVLDKDNVTGFGDGDTKPLIAIYTCHNPKTGEQQQCIAYSLDYIHFTKFEGNPVIKNRIDDENYQVDFRDPKVFENPVKGGYSMVLAVGRTLEFYHSANLIDWQKTGVFDPAVNGFYGICECPDCFPLECDGETKWILSCSSILEDDKVGHRLSEKGFNTARVMQYFVGDFDGDIFIDTEKYREPLVLDYGTDNYAMVTFSNCSKPLAIGWGEHWDYAMKTPYKKRRGKMTIVRKLSLVRVGGTYRLRQEPYWHHNDFGKEKEPCVIDFDIGNVERMIFYDSASYKEVLKFEVDKENVRIKRKSFIKDDKYNVFTFPRIVGNRTNLKIIRDGNYFEIFAENGLMVFSVMTY